MAAHNELLFGTIALDLGLITREQLDECVRVQTDPNIILPASIGNLLLQRRYLKPHDLPKVLREQGVRLQRFSTSEPQQARGEPLGQLLVRNGFVNRYQLHECLRLQAWLREEFGLPLRLGELMVRKRYMTREQIRIALDRQVQGQFRCVPCATPFKVVLPKKGVTPNCPTCGGVCEPVPSAADDAATEWLLDVYVSRKIRYDLPEPPQEDLQDLAVDDDRQAPTGGLGSEDFVDLEPVDLPASTSDVPVLAPLETPSPVPDEVALDEAPAPGADLALRPEEIAAARATPRRLGQALLVRRVRTGPRGELWLGVGPEGDRPVLVKWMNPGSLPTASASRRWIETSRRVAACGLPGVLRILGLAQEAGRPFMCFEAAEVVGLDALRALGLLSSRHAWQLAESLLGLLIPLHRIGVVHGNLKLANLLVPSAALRGRSVDAMLAETGAWRLADFGLPPLATFGSPGPAPEQLDAEREPDVRADVYAVGMILRLLNVEAVANHGADGGLACRLLLRRATAEAPQQRFRDGEDMLRALQELRRGLNR